MKTIFLSMLLIVSVSAPALFAQDSYNSPETGTKVLGNYFATDVDSVDLQNGNLHIRIPLFSLSGRELPLSFGMDYNSQFLEKRSYVDENGITQYVWEFQGWRKVSRVGMRFDSSKNEIEWGFTNIWIDGVNYDRYRLYDLTITWIDGTGAKYRFTKSSVYQYWVSSNPNQKSPSDAVLYDNLTIDTSGSDFIRLNTGTYFSGGANPLTITLKEGSRLSVATGGTAELRTVNGNKLTATSATQTVLPTGKALGDTLPLSDTVARTISFSTTADSQTITTTSSTGAAQTYTINFANITRFNPDGGGNITLRVVSSIVLPNSRSYTFQYDSGISGNTGYLLKMIFPSGAYIRYDYRSSPYFPNDISWWVAHRYISADGTAASEKTWTYAYGVGANVVTTVSTAVSTEVHTIAGGLEMRLERKNEGSTVLETIDKTWQGGPTTNGKIITTTTNMNGIVRKTTAQYDAYNNITRQDDYDWGNGAPGPLLRYITRTFVTAAVHRRPYVQPPAHREHVHSLECGDFSEAMGVRQFHGAAARAPERHNSRLDRPTNDGSRQSYCSKELAEYQ